MFRSVNILFQKFFIKKRYIFTSNNDFHIETIHLSNDYFLSKFHHIKEIQNISLQKTIKVFCISQYSQKGAFRRLNNSAWKCYAIICKKSSEVAGIAWLIHPNFSYWYDNVRFSSDVMHFANIYVSPDHRGKNLGKYLYLYCYKEAFSNAEYKSIASIVESYRQAAIHNQLKVSRIAGRNYLIKFIGLNLFSLYIGKYVKLWYVGPLSNRKWKFIKNE